MQASLKTVSIVWLLASPAVLAAQPATDVSKILERLSKVEEENNRLRDEIRDLKSAVTALRAVDPVETREKLDIQERRIEEQAQTKVEASQRFPIRITGMALFNTFYNTRNANNADIATTAAPVASRAVGGATFRQSVFGLEFNGPQAIWGGKVRGSLMTDFYDGATEANAPPIHIRTASIEINWKTTSLLAGLQKPIFNPREPNSLMTVGISPLTASGNLWRWQPQVRLDQRAIFSPSTELRAQVGVYQTSEDSGVPANPVLRRRRPGFEGRFELAHRFDDTRRIEVAPGFHFSTTQVGGLSVPSRLASIDWFTNPWSRLEFSGFLFNGQNIHHFGAFRQGFRLLPSGEAIPVHSRGGWGQFTILATDRLSFNLFGGIHDDRESDLARGAIGRNRSHAGNVMYRLAPNVIVSFEALQTRTTYIGAGERLLNRYDLALAYLF